MLFIWSIFSDFKMEWAIIQNSIQLTNLSYADMQRWNIRARNRRQSRERIPGTPLKGNVLHPKSPLDSRSLNTVNDISSSKIVSFFFKFIFGIGNYFRIKKCNKLTKQRVFASFSFDRLTKEWFFYPFSAKHSIFVSGFSWPFSKNYQTL